MRWRLGLLSLALAVLFWLGSLLADPYTSWGVEHEHVRPSVAVISVNFALASLACQSTAALLVFWDVAPITFWDLDHRRGRGAIVFAIPLILLAATMIWRLAWIEFVVLAR